MSLLLLLMELFAVAFLSLHHAAAQLIVPVASDLSMPSLHSITITALPKTATPINSALVTAFPPLSDASTLPLPHLTITGGYDTIVVTDAPSATSSLSTTFLVDPPRTTVTVVNVTQTSNLASEETLTSTSALANTTAVASDTANSTSSEPTYPNSTAPTIVATEPVPTVSTHPKATSTFTSIVTAEATHPTITTTSGTSTSNNATVQPSTAGNSAVSASFKAQETAVYLTMGLLAAVAWGMCML